MYDFLQVKKWGLERLADEVGFIPNLSHYCRKLAFLMLLKPQQCTQEYAYVCMLQFVYTGCDSCTQAEGHFGHLILQKQIFAHLKGYIFYFNTPQVNLISYWVLNQSWALEFEHHWGTETQVVRGIKCDVSIKAIRKLIDLILNKIYKPKKINPTTKLPMVKLKIK